VQSDCLARAAVRNEKKAEYARKAQITVRSKFAQLRYECVLSLGMIMFVRDAANELGKGLTAVGIFLLVLLERVSSLLMRVDDAQKAWGLASTTFHIFFQVPSTMSIGR